MAGDNDGRQAFNSNLFHFLEFLLGSYHRLQLRLAGLQLPEFIFANANLFFQSFDAGDVRIVLIEVANLFQAEPHPFEGQDALHLLKLVHAVVSVPGIPVHYLRHQQVYLLIMPERPYRDAAKA